MDSLAGAAVHWNIEALKEPRGFIRFIEFIIAIFAFATTTSSSSSSSFYVKCENNTQKGPFEFSWQYPFRLEDSAFEVTSCNGSDFMTHPYGNYSSPSQFFVFVGVMAFLYCIGAVILYVCFDDHYRKFDKIPIFDFVATCVFVLLWLISSSAWASGVSDIKLYTNPLEFQVDIVPDCRNDQCVVDKHGNYASLNVSIIFGFLNMCVWAANLWFLYKETKWFKVETQHPDTSPSDIPQKV